jgi:hypothetical protein
VTSVQQLLVFAFFVGCGLAMLGLRWWADRSELGRARARQLYSNHMLLFHMRASITTAPIIGTGLILLGILAMLPKLLAAWLSIPAILLGVGGLLLTYRVPQRLVPRWMREEQEAGRLEVARPDRLDWLVFWVLLPLVVIGPFAIVALIVVYDSVQP